MRSRQAIEYQFRDVEPEARKAKLGGTLAGLLGDEGRPRVDVDRPGGAVTAVPNNGRS